MILARAGLIRLGLEDEIAEVIDPATMVPAVGQGALGIEIREGDTMVANLLHSIDHLPTRITSEAERAFLRHLEGGCQAPIGAYATLVPAEEDGDREGYPVRHRIDLLGLIASLDGKMEFRDSISRLISDNPDEATSIGIELADRLLAEGGEGVLREIYGSSM
jgi:hydroxymethylbilane synthase